MSQPIRSPRSARMDPSRPGGDSGRVIRFPAPSTRTDPRPIYTGSPDTYQQAQIREAMLRVEMAASDIRESRRRLTQEMEYHRSLWEATRRAMIGLCLVGGAVATVLAMIMAGPRFFGL